MKASEISNVIRPAEAFLRRPDDPILHLLTDSRTLVSAHGTLFFAIPTKRNSGCRYIDGLYQAGVRQFVVPADCDIDLPEANIWRVDDVLDALQRLAAHHRSQFAYPVVGITGSNGKTIVKDWIVQLLSPDRRLVSSPKSYNSQIGVPLSVWQMEAGHEMAVFEAGISETGEMARLQKIIQPTIGIFTNVGQAHDENFLTRQQKVAEKLQLFTHCDVLIYSTDHKDIHSVLSDIESFRHINRFTWGSSADNAVQLLDATVGDRSTSLSIAFENSTFSVSIPFVDRASQQNVMHCITLMLYLGYTPADIAARCAKLTPVEMRLEMNEGINNCLLINDSYSLDLNSLSIALDFLQHEHQHFNKTLIISDFLQTGVPDSELYTQVAQLVSQRGITRLIGVGPALCHCKECFAGIDAQFFPSTEQMLHDCDFNRFQNEAILLKGARLFEFEKVAKLLQRKSHETIMEVNLDAMIHNLNYYRSRINSGTKLMAMVKAASYGAGKVEVASALQFNHVDYLTVAYADEGVELRRNGIHLPIMVMNPEEASFDDIVKYRLEPDIYSFRILELFSQRVRLYGERMAIHVEFDTGMHRLGFSGDDIPALAERLNALKDILQVRSIFSHLACSEDPAMDDFTRGQINRFRTWSEALKARLAADAGETPALQPLCHILNSSGITRFPEAQMDMVRLGIGLYGIAPEEAVQAQLRQVSRLVTRISQIKAIPEGDSVGYNRRWIAQRPSHIAIVPIGYADGLSRHLGYGHGRVSINGAEAPIIGSVCMDMCFVDVTDLDCAEGDAVVLFGEGDLLQRNAEAAGTIPYEMLTAVSPRVKRVYFQE
ncbi:MAG: bifunctional UDP-N-acetylmuramoyl-tripeptide:D-alanyl-D-alanine ligase/alanine racemase [Bacteroidales bacterium]|nr:bifunctional UDP-N-acetylmuramoyl-tripeptide:D-alanyl-D-alanine ligase/alanine racemase [Bacteroidales bacterium]